MGRAPHFWRWRTPHSSTKLAAGDLRARRQRERSDHAIKSFAGLISLLLEDWGKFSRFLLLLSFAGLLALALAAGVLRSLPRNTGQVKFGSGSILFSQPTPDGHEYLVVVPPQGWQETGIAVREGDHVTVEANGKVNIDLSGLNAALAARRAADERILGAERQSGRWESEMDSFAPEDHYTAEERQNMRPTWPWVGPDGIPEAETERFALPARLKRRLTESAGYGALLGAIRETGARPAQSDVFFLGSNYDRTAKRSGKLYFAVNDVRNDNKDYPEMFFADNIGFFYAKVTIRK